MAAHGSCMSLLSQTKSPAIRRLFNARINTFSTCTASCHPSRRLKRANAKLPKAESTLTTSNTSLPTTPIEEDDSPAVSATSILAQPTGKVKQRFEMKTYKPRTPGLRHLRRSVNDHLWKGRPFLPLTLARKGHGVGGRNRSGRITVRHRGGGHKRRIRTVDFDRLEPGPHKVERIEKDPGRTGHLALIKSEATGKFSYILASDGLRAGDVVQSYRAGIPKELIASMGGTIDPGMLAAKTAWRGNCLPLHMVPVGSVIHAIGMLKGGKAKFCRSAGTYGTVISKDEDLITAEESLPENMKHWDKVRLKAKRNNIEKKFVIVRLQSGEIRKFHREVQATIGVVSNPTYHHEQLGKAGRKRWLGIRPTVRGLAMNACDHPHGGGRGKSKGNVHPVSPWGIPTKSGYKTRNVHKKNRWLVKERPRNHGKRRNTT